jgi:hypothetical protein
MKIIKFLNNYNIPYIIEGNNVKKGNINIKCPFCGNEDKSEHLGISPDTGVYGCWRNSEHRGKDFAKVVVRLIGCSYEEAKRLISTEVIIPGDSILDYINNLFDDKPDEEITTVTHLELAEDFIPIVNKGIRKVFWQYFRSRGFNGSDSKLENFIDRFNILCSLSGYYKMRLIFPIYFEGRLVTWQTRSIYPKISRPYIDLSVDESVKHVKQCVYNYDELINGGDILYITEGVFDCLKIEYFAPKDFHATCIFTKTLTDSQVYLLTNLSRKFRQLRLLLDSDAWQEAYFGVKGKLSHIKNLIVQGLPEGAKDPGQLKKSQVKSLISL